MSDPIVVGGILRVAGTLIDRLFPDKNARDEAKLKLLDMELSGELAKLAKEERLATGQMEVNKAEAAHRSVFVAGWRPSVGWICSGAVAYQFVLHPFLAWYAVVNTIPVPPSIDTGALMTLLMGMLGLGAYRTFEKVKGVAK